MSPEAVCHSPEDAYCTGEFLKVLLGVGLKRRKRVENGWGLFYEGCLKGWWGGDL